MSTHTFDLDQKQYGKLLAATRPSIIKSEAENDRLLSCIEDLMWKGENNLSAAEGTLLELLANLVHDYEQRQQPTPDLPPHQMVNYLLEQQGREPSALLPMLGTKSWVSELLSGKLIERAAARIAALRGIGDAVDRAGLYERVYIPGQ